MREIVLKMKHLPGEALALSMGRWLGQRLIAEGWQEKFDCVLPIPMYWLSRMLRGYHSADPIALGCAAELKKPCFSDVLLSRSWRKRQAST